MCLFQYSKAYVIYIKVPNIWCCILKIANRLEELIVYHTFLLSIVGVLYLLFHLLIPRCKSFKKKIL